MDNFKRMESVKALRPPHFDDDDDEAEVGESATAGEWEDPTSPPGSVKNAAFQNFSEPDPTTLGEAPEHEEQEQQIEQVDPEEAEQAVPEIDVAPYRQDFSNHPTEFDDEPAATEEEHAHEEPVHEEEPAHEEEPVHEEEPAHEEAPAHEEEPVHEEEPAHEEEPVHEEPAHEEPAHEEPAPAIIQSHVNEEEERLALENSRNRSRPSRRFNESPAAAATPAASTSSTTSSSASSTAAPKSWNKPAPAAPVAAAAAVEADAPKAEPKKWTVQTNYVRAGMRSTKATAASTASSSTGRSFQGLSGSAAVATASASSSPASSGRYSSSASTASSAPAPTPAAAPSSSSSSYAASAPAAAAPVAAVASKAAAPLVASNSSSGVVGSDAEGVVRRIVAADEEVTWALFEYKKQLEVAHQGNGTVDDLRKHLDQGVGYFGYLRTTVGAEQRNKFVLIKWVGERLSPMARARMLEHEAQVKKIIKIYHIEIPTSALDELVVSKVAARLAKAGGANYDKNQNVAGATDDNTQFNSYKGQSKDFFSSIERSGNVRSVQYVSHALPKSTPVDLSARQMTVGASTNQKNLVLDVPGVDSKRTTGQE